mgnify:CR=1 FL=1
MEELEPDQLQPFNIPENLLEKLFLMTGNADNSRGFILAYVAQNGKPMVFSKTDTQIVEMGLRKALEEFLVDIGEKERTFGLDAEEEE